MNEGQLRSLELCQFSLSGLPLTVLGLEEVVDDREVVDHRAGHDKEMPDGVRERDSSVALEEDDADDVNDAAEFQLEQARLVFLQLTINTFSAHIVMIITNTFLLFNAE